MTDLTILGVGAAFPPSYYDQDTLTEKFVSVWGDRHWNTARLRALHEYAVVGGRHLALPIDDYESLRGLGAANDAWIRVGLDVGAEAMVDADTRRSAARRHRCALRGFGDGIADA